MLQSSTSSRLRLILSFSIVFIAPLLMSACTKTIATEYEEITRPNIEGQDSSEYIEAGRLWQGIWGKNDQDSETKSVLRRIIGLYSQLIQDGAHKSGSELINAYINRGVAYHRLGSYQLAVADYNAALSISPNLADALKNRGLSYEAMGRNQEALRDFELFLALTPQDIRPEEYEYFTAKIYELREQVEAPTPER